MRITYTCPMCAAKRDEEQGKNLFCQTCRTSGYTVLMEPPLEVQHALATAYLANASVKH